MPSGKTSRRIRSQLREVQAQQAHREMQQATAIRNEVNHRLAEIVKHEGPEALKAEDIQKLARTANHEALIDLLVDKGLISRTQYELRRHQRLLGALIERNAKYKVEEESEAVAS